MTQHRCSYCGGEMVLLAGKCYCAEHVRHYDSPIIANLVLPLQTLTPEAANEFFLWAFGTKEPRFSDFPKLYDRVERGEWSERNKRFDKPQDIYLLEAYIKWLEEVRK